ncbi:MAG: hypothetical protein K8S20_07735 [Chloroflexi bacterium]|nr:hypothetical protein [Chloroflexota bacterium]
MHRHKRFRYGPPFFRPHRHFGGGLFWLIGLAILFSSGHGIWPGILVLIGLSTLFGSLFREQDPREPYNPAPFQPSTPVTPPPAPITAPASFEPLHPADLLPLTCPQCGGPIRSYEVKWTGRQSAACPYCNSNLPINFKQ